MGEAGFWGVRLVACLSFCVAMGRLAMPFILWEGRDGGGISRFLVSVLSLAGTGGGLGLMGVDTAGLVEG